jgi:DNA-binding transcriptional MerR regulator
MLAQERKERLKKIFEAKRKKGHQNVDEKLANEYFNAIQEYGHYFEKVMEQREAITRKARRLDDENNLSELEKKILSEDPSIKKNINRLLFGMVEQVEDFWSGLFARLIQLKKGDKNAEAFFRKELAGFVKIMMFKYKMLGLSMGVVYEAMTLGAENWEKAKYRGYMPWIKVQMEDYFKRARKKFFQSDEICVDFSNPKLQKSISNIEMIDEDKLLDECEEGEIFKAMLGGKISKEEAQESSATSRYYRKKLLWVEEAAKLVGVSPQTLRNWDKDETFKANRKEHLGRSYRVYDPADIDELILIKEEKQAKKRGVLGRCEYPVEQVAKFLNISRKTLGRKEKSKIIPFPKRHKDGQRYYSPEDIKKIAKILGSKITFQ